MDGGASVGGTEKGGSGLLSFNIYTGMTEQIGQEHAARAVWGPPTHTHTHNICGGF